MDKTSNELAKYSRKYLSQFTETVSLKKLEKEIEAGENGRLPEVAAAFVYYNDKLEKLNEIDHALLLIETINFMNEFNSKELKNKYAKINNNILTKIKQKEVNSESKDIIRKRVKNFMAEKNLSVPTFCRMANEIDRSNLNKFLNGNDDTISLEKLNRIRRLINNGN